MASYEQRENSKLWTVRFRYVDNGIVKNKRMSGFNTKKLAEKNYIDFMSAYKPQEKIVIKKTLNDMSKLYFNYISDRVKETTIYTYTADYNKHIKNKIGNILLKDLNKLEVLNWQKYLNQNGYSYKYKTKIRNLLSNIFDYAIFYYDYPINPVKQVENFRKVNEKKIEKNVWSFNEFKSFIANVNDSTYNALFNFLYFTGARKSEAFALTWKDVEFKNNRININKTLSRKVIGVPFKVMDTPKSHNSTRQILMPHQLFDVLKSFKKPEFQPSDFVFGGKYPLAENTVARTMDRFIITTNKIINDEDKAIARLTPHELRHSHASYLISKGISIVTVSKRLGHTSIEETLKTYTHLMPSDEEKILEVF